VDKHPIVVGLTLLLGVARAGAAPSKLEPLTVSLSGCPIAPVSATAFVSAIELELNLRDRPVLLRADAPAAISVRVDCSGKASIRIRLGRIEDRRDVRVDDVANADRPRVLALVVAELVRSDPENAATAKDEHDADVAAVPGQDPVGTDSPRAAAPSDARRNVAKRPVSKVANQPERSAAPAQDEHSRFAAVVTRRDGLRPWMCAWLHLNSAAPNALSGGAAGIQWHRSRLQTELGFAYADRDRGSITSGVAAARYRYSAHRIGDGRLVFDVALSSAAGATWAVGDSEIPGVIVRRALSPYADARIELALELWLAERINAELNVYSGGAWGLLATDVGDGALSSGGWLLGASIGSSF
jgi:hypothetical protein